jgi:hypothetical protein
MQLESTIQIELLSVREVYIHQSLYYDIGYAIPPDQIEKTCRINPEAFYPDPKPGDRVEVVSMMGNIVSARCLR